MDSFISILVFLLAVVSASAQSGKYEKEKGKGFDLQTFLASEDYLSYSYYYKTCPNAEAIINRKVKEWVRKDYSLAASLMRLHFHDCAVRV